MKSSIEHHAHPPIIRGIHAMAAVRWLLLAAVANLSALTWWQLGMRGESVAAGPDRYYCPMHPQIRSPVPGTCPICYMNLELIPEEHTHPTDPSDSGPVEPDGPPDVGLATVMLTTERRQMSGIRTIQAYRAPVGGTVRWPAVIEARDGSRIEVRTRTAAFVERAVVRETGVLVRAGQVLAWVYSPEILRAEEEMLSARRWHQEAARSERVTVRSPEESARERLHLLGVAEAEIERVIATGRAERRVPLRAPMAGYVTRFQAVVGSRAMPDTVLYEITDLSRVRVVASAFGAEIAKASQLSSARFIPRDGGSQADLRLELVEPELANETRTARVRFLAANPDTDLLPGQIGEVLIEGSAREVTLVPRDAVIDLGLSQYVFVEHERGVFEPRVIETGPLWGEAREVISGLVPGEVVVARGAFVLDSESRLRAALAPRTSSSDSSDSSQPARIQSEASE